MQSLRSTTRLLLTLTAALGLIGCASFTPHPPLPMTTTPINVGVSDDPPGMNDYPIGSYTIPGSQVVITKPRQVSTVEGGFGAFGALAAHYSGKADSKAMIEGIEASLGIPLEDHIAQGIRSASANAGQRWAFAAKQSDRPYLKLEPFIYLSPDNSGQTSLFLFIKAELADVTGAEVWDSRYVYRHPAEYPLKGDNSWSEGDGRLLKAALNQGFATVAEVLVNDSDRTAAQWSSRPARIKSAFFGSEPFEINGEILKQTDDTLIFNAAGGGILYGINILPLDTVDVLPPATN